MLNIVLHQPEIPANTGNIGRTCVATGTVLHLIEPLGFSLSEKQLKRAGMDYWNLLDVRRYINFADFLEKNPTLVSGEPGCAEALDGDDESASGLQRCKDRTGRLYYVRQRECRNPGGNPCGV